MVCTGNVCRSPLAEQLLARALAARAVDADVSSAGVVGAGLPAASEVIELLEARGLDGRGHRSRLLSPDLLARADLVLGMAREHVREAAIVEPDLLPRAFTLKELVRRGRAVGPRPAGETLAGWLVRVGADRHPAAMIGASAHDDVADPVGLPYPVHRQVATEIDGLITELVDLAWPPAPVEPAGTGG